MFLILMSMFKVKFYTTPKPILNKTPSNNISFNNALPNFCRKLSKVSFGDYQN